MPRKRRKSKPTVVTHRLRPHDENSRAHMLELLRNRVEECPKALTKLQAVLSGCDPLSVMASFAFYGLQVGVSDEDGTVSRSEPHVLPHHGELLQAIILSFPMDQWGDGPVTTLELQTVFDTIDIIASVGPIRRVLEDSSEDTHNRELANLQHRVRLHTQAVRNWGYFEDVVKISTDLYRPLDRVFNERAGFGPSTLIRIARSILAEVESRQNKHSERLTAIRRFINCETVDEMFATYGEEIGQVVCSKDLTEEDLDQNQALQLLWMKLDQDLPLAYQFTADSLAELSGCDKAEVKAATANIAISPTSLVDQRVDELLLANPMWTAPVIQLDCEKYFSALPVTIFNYVHQLFDQIGKRYDLTQKLQQQRSAYLEQRVAEIFRAVIPGAAVKSNARWRFEGRQYETDCLVVADKTVIAIEAKAGHLTPQALRGAPLRLKKHVKPLLSGLNLENR